MTVYIHPTETMLICSKCKSEETSCKCEQSSIRVLKKGIHERCLHPVDREILVFQRKQTDDVYDQCIHCNEKLFK